MKQILDKKLPLKKEKIVKKRLKTGANRKKGSYEKTMSELAPFIPKVATIETTTEGTWQKSASASIVSY